MSKKLILLAACAVALALAGCTSNPASPTPASPPAVTVTASAPSQVTTPSSRSSAATSPTETSSSSTRSSQAPNTSKVPTVTETVTPSGTFILLGVLTILGTPPADLHYPDVCTGSGVYSDIVEGYPLYVYNQNGVPVDSTTVGEGTINLLEDGCEFGFGFIAVPDDLSTYFIGNSDRGVVEYSPAELNEGFIDLTLGP